MKTIALLCVLVVAVSAMPNKANRNALNIKVETELRVASNNKTTTTETPEGNYLFQTERSPSQDEAALSENEDAFTQDQGASLFTTTTEAEPKMLICNCTYPGSRYCTSEGTCNSLLISRQLSKEVELAKAIMETLREFPGDAPRREMREQFCRILTAAENITDLTLLEFDNWEPACVRLETPDGQDIHTCSVAPKEQEFGRIRKEQINEKIRAFHAYLQCPENQPPTLVNGDMHFCRDGDSCNTQERNYDTVVELEKTPEAATGDGLTQKQAIVYIGLPILGLFLLILLAALVIYGVGKATGWSYVWNVQKAAAAGSNGANSEVASGLSGETNA